MSFDKSDDFAEWRADQVAKRLASFKAKRPVRLCAEGELDPAIAAWGDSLAERKAGNLIIIGGVGVGKTWSAWEVLERAIARGYDGTVMVSGPTHWAQTIDPPLDHEELHKMTQVGALAFDDLGSARMNDWQRECLMRIVDDRWQHARPIIVTANTPPTGNGEGGKGWLEETLGERLASRLKDGAVKVAINSADRRNGR